MCSWLSFSWKPLFPSCSIVDSFFKKKKQFKRGQLDSCGYCGFKKNLAFSSFSSSLLFYNLERRLNKRASLRRGTIWVTGDGNVVYVPPLKLYQSNADSHFFVKKKKNTKKINSLQIYILIELNVVNGPW